MAEAEQESPNPDEAAGDDAPQADLEAAADNPAVSDELDEDEINELAAQAEAEVAAEAAPPAVPAGPGRIRRALTFVARWHPFFLLGMAFCLAAYAWMVYPREEERVIPPAEDLYIEGLTRLYRVLNPDLPLLADSPVDEALAARNSFLNLFVFHRPTLNQYPQFVNPHLLLAEANRILAENDDALRDNYYADASAAYIDAVFWENREDDAQRLALYVANNFFDGDAMFSASPPDINETLRFFEENEDAIATRRARRLEYIRFRQAEADLELDRPELARDALETIQRDVTDRQRESLRRTATDEAAAGELPRRVFELGPDDFRRLDLLLARANDDLGRQEEARNGYLRYLSAVPSSRAHAFVIERLAAIAMEDGEVYRRVDPERASEFFQSASDYYAQILSSPSSTAEQRESSVLGMAMANSRLAQLTPDAPMTGVDELADAGRSVRAWLESFSGQPLPRRTVAMPMAAGRLLAEPEMVFPTPLALPAAVAGEAAAMAGGDLEPPFETRRRHLTMALDNFDQIAEMRAGTEAGDRAALAAAWESWRLGRMDETETRFDSMIDPLSSQDLVQAARVGLATVALARGDVQKASMQLLGGYAHPGSLWFTPADADWRKIAAALGNPGARQESGALDRLWQTLPEAGKQIAEYAASGRTLDDDYINRFLRVLNTTIRRRDFYQPEYFPPLNRNRYLEYVLSLDPERLTDEEVVWRNRLLLEEAWPYDLSQKAGRDNIGYEPLPPAIEIPPGGLLEPERIRDSLMLLARAWENAAAGRSNEERWRMLWQAVETYRAALDQYRGEPGEILYDLARNYEALAEIRESQGNHPEALSLTATAARSYLDVSLRARGSPREMDALLAAGDAFFRSGLLERTVESQRRFLDRFGYSSTPGGDAAMQVVRAENLLGRAYWFLADLPNALASFNRNVSRRTPDRFKSMYYIGRVLMEEGLAHEDAALLGSDADPLPPLDRNGDPVISTAMQAFNYVRQSPGINPDARAWRWSTFDLANLKFNLAEQARRDWEAETAAAPADPGQPPPQPDYASAPWLPLYDDARMRLTEALDRYPLRRNGGVGVSIRVEPEDYADVMASRFEAEYLLAKSLLILAQARNDEGLSALARTHLANLSDNSRYASALFDPALDRFQLNAAVIREEIEGGNWDRTQPLPRTRLGDDEGPTHSPQQMRNLLRNGMQLLASEYFRAGDRAAARAGGAEEAATLYRNAYATYQQLYDRFGAPYGALAMLGMGDSLSRLGRPDDAANHYRMAENIANLQPADTSADGLLDMGPAFWGTRAADRLNDRAGGYTVP